MIALPVGILALVLAQADFIEAHAVSAAGAAWVRLHFGQIQLAEGSVVRVTSALDGGRQELDAAALALWQGTSAYFNGDTVTVELLAAPTTGNRLIIDRIESGPPEPAGGGCQFSCGICGATDDRVPSDELWVGRLLPLGCAAAVYNAQSCMISAGHCMAPFSVVEFNVPQSSPNCAIQHPAPEDQFPVVAFESRAIGPGDDWAASRVGENNLGQTPVERYGAFRALATSPASPGETVQVTGYGCDLDCAFSQTQQAASGPICGVFAKMYGFSADTRAGSGGSPLLLDDRIIGVFTHCPCCNIATRVDHADFQAALATICPACPWDLDNDGVVAVIDFLALLAAWGQTGVPADFDGDGVGIGDFLTLLANWGACP